MNQLVISTLRKLQWLVGASYASAAVDAFSSWRKHSRVLKIHQHLYLDHQHVQILHGHLVTHNHSTARQHAHNSILLPRDSKSNFNSFHRDSLAETQQSEHLQLHEQHKASTEARGYCNCLWAPPKCGQLHPHYTNEWPHSHHQHPPFFPHFSISSLSQIPNFFHSKNISNSTMFELVTSDVASQYRCGRVGRGSQHPSAPNIPSSTDTCTKSF